MFKHLHRLRSQYIWKSRGGRLERRLKECLTSQLDLRTGLHITGENILEKKVFVPSLNLRPVTLTTWLR